MTPRCRGVGIRYSKDVRARIELPIVALLALSVVASKPTRADSRSAQSEIWSGFTRPHAGPAQAIGSYGNGCLQGAARVPRRGKGFRVVRPWRNRHWAHPQTIALLRDLGRRLARRGLGAMLIADVAQPRGGPAPSGHASHQTGLDADIWFATPAQARRAGSRRLLQPVSLIDGTRKTTSKHWRRRTELLLRWAAEDARVSRIFVHPLIKQRLCHKTRGDRTWLRKIRPWWGHHEHFHVRLVCPARSTDCTPQADIRDGDGCDKLQWWLAERAKRDRTSGQASYQTRIRARPPMPTGCATVQTKQ